MLLLLLLWFIIIKKSLKEDCSSLEDVREEGFLRGIFWWGFKNAFEVKNCLLFLIENIFLLFDVDVGVGVVIVVLTIRLLLRVVEK